MHNKITIVSNLLISYFLYFVLNKNYDQNKLLILLLIFLIK